MPRQARIDALGALCTKCYASVTKKEKEHNKGLLADSHSSLKSPEAGGELLSTKSIENETARSIFKAGYKLYNEKNYELAIKTLDASNVPGDKIKILSLIWGTVGDCYFALEQVHRAIIAYRKSINHDETSSCINNYAYLVAKYGFKEDAKKALACLDKMREDIRNTSVFWRPFGQLFALLLVPKSWFISTFKVPLIRRKLIKMIN
jgi:tetratricopeptide (TPR) repeat protein